MRIIRRGQKPEDKQLKSTCQNCSTKFEFRKGEASDCSDRDGPCVKIQCPVCHKDCYVNPFVRSHVTEERPW